MGRLFKLGAKQLIAIIFFASVLLAASSTTKPQVDRILVIKSAHIMRLYNHEKVIKEYRIALGGQPVGAKQKEGDHKTPEGLYTIDSKNSHSQFHLSLHISYPSQQDRERARRLGVSPGGDIMIHGLPPAYAYLGAMHRAYDWTDGCIAVTNAEIEEIWNLVSVGTKVEIKP